MESILSNFFVGKQYVQKGLLLYFSDKDMEEFEYDLHLNRLKIEDYEQLLTLPYWEWGFIPFFLAGFRIFNISPGDLEGDEPNLPPSSSEVLPIFSRVWEAIRNGDLLIEKNNLSITLPFRKAILQTNISILDEVNKDFFNNANKYPIKIKPARVIEWAIINDIKLQQNFLDLLGVYQEKTREYLKLIKEEGYSYLKKLIDQPKKLTVADENEIEYLAAAQVLWFQEKNLSKSQIAKHPLLKNFGPEGGYSKNSKYPLKLLSLIDPAGEKRPKGGFKSSKVSSNRLTLPRSIPGLWLEENGTTRMNLKAVKIAFIASIRALQILNSELNQEGFFLHPIISQYFEGRHPIFKEILTDWLEKALEDPESVFKDCPWLRNR